MDIIFANNKIRKACQNASGKLKRRLDDISASEDMGILELLPGRLHALRENKSGLWAMDLEHPLRLILEPVANPLPLSKDGWLDLKKITAVKIIKVEDYHGK